jgi:hypothetical protein
MVHGARGRKERHDGHPSYLLGHEGSSKEYRDNGVTFMELIYEGDFLTCPIGPKTMKAGRVI